MLMLGMTLQSSSGQSINIFLLIECGKLSFAIICYSELCGLLFTTASMHEFDL